MQPRLGQRGVTSYKMTSFTLPSRLKYVVTQLKRGKFEKSTTHQHHSHQRNLLNNQQLRQPRTCPLPKKLSSIMARVDIEPKTIGS